MILIAPDSFKGSLSAMEVARAMEAGIKRVWPEEVTRLFPMADGGEGTLEAILAATGGQARHTRVTGAHEEAVDAAWGLLETPQGPTAVLEAAQVVGITMDLKKPVAQRSTQGLGELVKHCLDLGIRRFMIGLGGSSTNDGGAGILAALGVQLRDAAGRPLAPTPDGLAALASVDFRELEPRLAEAHITIMSDVNNPLCGEWGATAVFGPQKGVAPHEVAVIDGHLRQLGHLCDAAVGTPFADKPGAGAAGGLGYALQLLGGHFRSGAEVVLDLLGFEAAMQQASWVMTGEGRSDAQTLLGKVPHAVATHASRYHVPVTLVSGGVDQQSLAALSSHFAGCFSIIFRPMTLEQAMQEAAAMVADCAEQIARLRAACLR